MYISSEVMASKDQDLVFCHADGLPDMETKILYLSRVCDILAESNPEVKEAIKSLHLEWDAYIEKKNS